jgi:trk system potassium uptake protein
MFRSKVVLHLIGLLLFFNGIFMAIALFVGLYYQESSYVSFLWSSAISINVGGAIFLFTRKVKKEITKRDGFLVVSLGWLSLVVSGSLPYFFSGVVPNYSSAFFETMSGYTTTGASIFSDIESLPNCILFWRSLTQWIGGMGIIVLVIAILPILGFGGVQLFFAESSSTKIHPRITDTAKRLWVIYFAFTVLSGILLYLAGMTVFDAVNHALTAISTGGFSTKNSSVAYFNSFEIQGIIIVFMFLGGTNFTLLYLLLKGNVKNFLKNEEFKAYGFITVGLAMILVLLFSFENGKFQVEYLFNSLFNVVSIITTTGYGTVDYTLWHPLGLIIILGLMFTGASAGSTSGGFKLVRHIIILKNGITEFKKIIHPNAVLPVIYNGKPVKEKLVYNILAFFFVFLFTFLISTILLSLQGYDFETAIGASIGCLGNIGPGIGRVGPMGNYEFFNGATKFFLSFLMLAGRLEIFTFFILFSPAFWRRF